MADLISVIVTTYNWPEALAGCLDSLLEQSDKDFEIIIADDGSGISTKQCIAGFLSKHPEIPLRHIYQEDHGFRAGTIRNKAVAASSGSYILFLDGDCLVFPQFIKRHRELAETGYFVPGNRMLLSQSFTAQILKEHFPIHQQRCSYFLKQRLSGNINRILPLLHLAFQWHRHLQPQNWQKAMTCNLGVWKADFIAVNGFDELFAGWGYEDSDLVVRLIHNRVRRKEGRFALPVLHLWHKQNDRSRHDANYQRLLERVKDQSCIRALSGVDQYL